MGHLDVNLSDIFCHPPRRHRSGFLIVRTVLACVGCHCCMRRRRLQGALILLLSQTQNDVEPLQEHKCDDNIGKVSLNLRILRVLNIERGCYGEHPVRVGILGLAQGRSLGVRKVHEVEDDRWRVFTRSGEVDALIGALIWRRVSKIRAPPKDSPESSPEVEFVLGDGSAHRIVTIETKLNLLEILLTVVRDGEDSAVEELDGGVLRQSPIPLHFDREKHTGFVHYWRVRDLPHGNRGRGGRRIFEKEWDNCRLWGWIQIEWEAVVVALDGPNNDTPSHYHDDEEGESDDPYGSRLHSAFCLKYSPSTALTASGTVSSLRAFRSRSKASNISSEGSVAVIGAGNPPCCASGAGRSESEP